MGGAAPGAGQVGQGLGPAVSRSARSCRRRPRRRSLAASPPSARSGWVAAAIRRHAERTSSSVRPGLSGSPKTVNGCPAALASSGSLPVWSPGRVYGRRGRPGSQAARGKAREPGRRVPPPGPRSGANPRTRSLPRPARGLAGPTLRVSGGPSGGPAAPHPRLASSQPPREAAAIPGFRDRPAGAQTYTCATNRRVPGDTRGTVRRWRPSPVTPRPRASPRRRGWCWGSRREAGWCSAGARRGPDDRGGPGTVAAGRGDQRGGRGAWIANISRTHALYAEGDGYRIRLPRMEERDEPSGGWFVHAGSVLVGSRAMLDDGRPLEVMVSGGDDRWGEGSGRRPGQGRR